MRRRPPLNRGGRVLFSFIAIGFQRRHLSRGATTHTTIIDFSFFLYDDDNHTSIGGCRRHCTRRRRCFFKANTYMLKHETD